MKYRWELKTTDKQFSGTSGSVFLSLHGLRAAIYPEVEISGDWRAGEVAVGMLDVPIELGAVETGTLRTTDTSEHWSVDYITITELPSGKQWTDTEVGTADKNGAFEVLRFIAIRDLSAEREDPDVILPEPPDGPVAPVEESADSSEPEAEGEEADKDSLIASLQSQLAEARREIAALRASRPKGLVSARTIEIYALFEGELYPIPNIKAWNVPGLQVLITDNPSEGYGLSGSIDKWMEFFPHESPADYGLELHQPVVCSDGDSPMPVSSKFLVGLLGGDWRKIVYGVLGGAGDEK